MGCSPPTHSLFTTLLKRTCSLADGSTSYRGMLHSNAIGCAFTDSLDVLRSADGAHRLGRPQKVEMTSVARTVRTVRWKSYLTLSGLVGVTAERYRRGTTFRARFSGSGRAVK